jgi:hypothetical protein
MYQNNITLCNYHQYLIGLILANAVIFDWLNLNRGVQNGIEIEHHHYLKEISALILLKALGAIHHSEWISADSYI